MRSRRWSAVRQWRPEGNVPRVAASEAIPSSSPSAGYQELPPPAAPTGGAPYI